MFKKAQTGVSSFQTLTKSQLLFLLHLTDTAKINKHSTQCMRKLEAVKGFPKVF